MIRLQLKLGLVCKRGRNLLECVISALYDITRGPDPKQHKWNNERYVEEGLLLILDSITSQRFGRTLLISTSFLHFTN